MRTMPAYLGNFYINNMSLDRPSYMPVQHYHDSYEIYFQIEGKREYFLDQTKQFSPQSILLNKGDLLIVKPFVIHRAQSIGTEGYKRYVMNFFPSSLTCILPEHEINMIFQRMATGVIHLDEMQMHRTLDFFTTIDGYTQEKSPLAHKLIHAELFQFLSFLNTLHTEIDTEPSLIPEEIAETIRYVRSHYAESIPLKFIIEHVHMSKSRFCHKFHETTGTSYMEYLYNVRMSIVDKLLLETKLPLHAIAAQTGFTSTAHMTRIFKQLHAISPREFRKMRNQGDVL